MSAYDYDPEVCEKVLEDTTEEILETLLTNKVQNHGYVRLQSNIEDVKTKRQNIRDCLWDYYNIPEKMVQLKELVANQTVFDYVPSGSGKENLNYHTGMKLLKQRDELKANINKIKSEIFLLQGRIIDLKGLLKKRETCLRDSSLVHETANTTSDNMNALQY